ncbi:MAG: sigma-70 family RNA polymerase sigma factor [Acidobacteria bacterium]|nr:sigma-70 family RNA polymerase sigma factor [Acidobacteriota bacterium]MDW7983492.1 sigma-70 family RNA polymerase sigma factor [Acidobacteriota bacterium]
MDDTALVERIRAGDRYAFNLLVWKWEKPIYNMALRVLGSEEDAAEICQEVFIKAYMHIHEFRGDARFSTWLYRIALNCCHNHLRRRQRQRKLRARVPDFEGVGLDEAAAPDAETVAHQAQLADRIRQALQGLPEDQRLVVELRVMHELSVEEVARIMGIPEGTVKSRLYYAVKRLRELLWPLLQEGWKRSTEDSEWLAHG